MKYLIVLLALFAGCSTSSTLSEGEAAYVKSIAAVAIASAQFSSPEIPTVTCDHCNNKGYIVHGDGHKTECPCGPAECDCNHKTLASLPPAEVFAFLGNYTDAYEASKKEPIRLLVHDGDWEGIPAENCYELDLSKYPTWERAEYYKRKSRPYITELKRNEKGVLKAIEIDILRHRNPLDNTPPTPIRLGPLRTY